ncbi:MAG TPA: XVIPCD domain-containing protein [Rhodanobacter sp.]
MDDDKYTVTVYVAAPGTPLANEAPGTTSEPGHMFYVTSNGHDKPQSFGFAPLQHGSMDGLGTIVVDDNENYKNPVYARTMEVSKSQYDKLNEFGSNPEKFGFDVYYKDARHNCVDFTWSGLNHVGIERQNHADIALPGMPLGPSVRLPLPGHGEGKSAYRPAENVDDVKSIKDPVPGSHLNSDHSNPMPAHRSVLQHLLSEQRLDDPAHSDFTLYQQAREGVHKIDAEHSRVPTVHSDNLAASLVISARASGMNQIDQVLVGRDAGRIFAVEGNLNSFYRLDQKLAHVEPWKR